MLTATHKSILNAMAQIITNTDGFIRHTNCIFGGEETHTIMVADSPLGNFFEFEGQGGSLEAAYEAVLREFEASQLGCPRAELFLTVAMNDAADAGGIIDDVSHTAPLESLIPEGFGRRDEIDIPFVEGAPKNKAARWDDPRYQSEETRRFVKETDARYVRRETKRSLKSVL